MGVMVRRADRRMHERDYTAREFGTRRYALTPFLQNNSVMMPLDPTPNSLGHDGRSVVRINGYRIDFGFTWSYGGGPISWSAKKQNSQ